MKQRFSSLDVQVIAHELSQTILHHRLSNIHDLSSRIFQFKFHSSSSKHLLIVDSGFRCHLTTFTRVTASSPSSFVERLRKYLKTRRVTGVKQVGTDRVLEIQFGFAGAQDASKQEGEDGKSQEKAIQAGGGGYRLFFEFFAGGNVILTDASLKILTLLRNVPEGPNQKQIAKGEIYDLSARQNINGVEPVTLERVRNAIQSAIQKKDVALEDMKEWQKKKAKKTRKDEGLNRVLGVSMTEFSPTLIEHCLISVGLDPDLKAVDVVNDDEAISKIYDAFKIGEKIMGDILDHQGDATGYIIAKQPTPAVPSTDTDVKKPKKKKKVAFGDDTAVKEAEKDLEAVLDEEEDSQTAPKTDSSGFIYDDFHPFLPIQFENKPNIHVITIVGYNKTVDSFFSSIESQKLEQRTQEKRAVAAKRLANARNEHKSKIELLHQQQELHIRKAQAIEANVERVEQVMDSVNGLIARGMDWGEIRTLIDRERSHGNPVAEMISDLKFMENTVVIKLHEEEEEDDDIYDDESGTDISDDEDADRREKAELKYLTVDIDLGQSVYANARTYYEQKKTAAVKEEKTLQSSAKALKSTERKIQQDLKKAYKAEKMELRSVRRTGWWEKFYWFKSSEGYLVLGARESTQADILYKRYFKRGDIYVHADVPGSCHVIVKNKLDNPKAPIPPTTLGQAGSLAVGTSEAWDRKQVISAWWAEFDQLSKIGAGGMVLGTGEFSVKGEKKWLPPAMLVMGFAVGWLVSTTDTQDTIDSDIEEMAEEMEADVERNLPEQDRNQAHDGETSKATEEDSDSDSEEFPDAKIESEDDEPMEKKPSEDEDDDDFPDAQLDDLNLEDEDIPEPSEDTVELPALVYGRHSHIHTPIDRTATSSPAPSIASTMTGSRHLSAKEKRDLKKARTKGAHASSGTSTPIPPAAHIRHEKQGQSAVPKSLSSKAAQQQNIRGKKGKQKKMAEKYRDQDEEDKLLALKLLGNARKDDADTPAEKAPDDAKSKAKEAEERQLKLKATAEKARLQTLQDETTRRDNAENYLDFEADIDESGLKLEDLKNVVPVVKGGAEILDAIPICAPWSALQKFEWKVKLQPGSQKKGKAVREIADRWGKEPVDKRRRKPENLDKSEQPETVIPEVEKGKKERELIRNWKEAEVVHIVPVGKVKVTIPGLADEKSGGGKGGKSGSGGKSGKAGGKKGKK